MSIFDKIIKRKARNEPNLTLYNNELYNFTSSTDCAEYERAIDVISNFLGSLTLQVWQNNKGKKERIKNEFSYWLDIEPCPGLTRIEWIKDVVRTMYNDGFCYVAVDCINNNKSLTVLHNTIRLSDNKIKSLERVYEERELLRFSIAQKSASQALKQTLKNLKMAEALKARFLKNSFTPPLAVFVDVDTSALTDDNDQRLKNLQHMITRSVDTGLPLIFEQGFVNIQELKGHTYNDLGLDTAQRDEQLKLASYFGLPSFFFGIGEYSAEEYNLFIKTTLMTLVKMFEQQLSKIFTSKDIFVRYNVESLLSIDLQEQLNFVSDCLAQGIMTPNEARQKLGLTPIEKEGMDDFRILENYVPLSKIGEQKKLKGKENE